MKTMPYEKKRFLIAPVILAALALFSAFTMLLWNALMPQIFHLPVINYWQAIGLLILARLFFGSGWMHRRNHSHGQGPRFGQKIKDKIDNMTPEERREFFRKLHRSHPHIHYVPRDEEVEKEADRDPK